MFLSRASRKLKKKSAAERNERLFFYGSYHLYDAEKNSRHVSGLLFSLSIQIRCVRVILECTT